MLVAVKVGAVSPTAAVAWDCRGGLLQVLCQAHLAVCNTLFLETRPETGFVVEQPVIA